MGESLSRGSGVIAALVRCAHGPLGPRPRAVWAALSRLSARPLAGKVDPGQPEPGRVDLGRGRQILRVAEETLQPVGPGPLHHP